MTIKEISRKLNLILLESGINGLQNTYKDLKPTIFPFGKIKETYIQYGYKDIPTGEADIKYAFLTPEELEPLIWDVMTLLHKTKYKLDFVDCDDYAYLCSALMSFLYGINTCGTMLGSIVNLCGHYFNVSITYKDGLFEMWCSDPLNPGITKILKGQKIIINDWEYQLRSARYF